MSLSTPGRKAGLLKAYLRRRPLWCSWQLTRRCESYCMFCEHRLEGAEAELDLDRCARVVDQLSRLGSLMVSLTGGEPFLRPDLPDVVRLLAGGCTYAEIGGRLGISAHTVASHIKNAYRKLEVHSAAAAVMRAVELRVLPGASPEPGIFPDEAAFTVESSG